MDAFYEEDERIVGHAADNYHRIDIRQSSRNLVVRHRDRIIADTTRPLVLDEIWLRAALVRSSVPTSMSPPSRPWNTRPSARTKGFAATTTPATPHLAAWSYPDAYPEVGRISNLVSFEPDILLVQLDGTQLHLETGQTVIPHGPDRDLTVAEVLRPRQKKNG